ncbi:hypothetical protein [Microseira sp. BLCC-F43]|jgi:predicted component of type VI protein secretion system|uniref:hypothetical protein n=1 Tax=Microseira sp. BLCC-F43 TaxID=3153602 RepID=UPI0035B8C73C
MTQMNPDGITGTISITVFPQDNGQYVCDISPSLSVGEASPKETRTKDCTRFYGQTKEHAIACALESLADEYRQKAEDCQNIDSLAVERSDSGESIQKHYHVILHYERIAKDESKFEAIHNTILGNTVVENAKISVIEISPDIEIDPLERGWD